MSNKEAKARIKINYLLRASEWRFFDDENGNANIQLALKEMGATHIGNKTVR